MEGATPLFGVRGGTRAPRKRRNEKWTQPLEKTMHEIGDKPLKTNDSEKYLIRRP
jgi:hypothetical protein